MALLVYDKPTNINKIIATDIANDNSNIEEHFDSRYSGFAIFFAFTVEL